MLSKTLLRTLTTPKIQQRIRVVITNSLNSFVLPLLNTFISALVIRLASLELWGKFVSLMIIVQLGNHLVTWGNKDYLLREFSRTPHRIGLIWQNAAASRVLLLTGVIFVLPVWIHSPTQWAYAALWVIGLAWYQSFDVFIQYHKDFAIAFWVEFLTLGGMLLGIFYLNTTLSVDILMLIFASSNLIKASVMTYHFRKYFTNTEKERNLDLTFFSAALPFFLLGLAGMLQTRIDLYSVSLYFDEAEVGKYQVFINMILYLQAIAGVILVPFVKNLYRLDYPTIRKISNRLFAFGMIILVPALFAIDLVVTIIYKLNFPVSFYVVGGLYALPLYYFAPIIYALFKAEKQKFVVGLNFTGTALVLGLNLFLLPNLGLLGAIVAVAVVHWGFLAVYIWQMKQLY